jgi:hypothetical protein
MKKFFLIATTFASAFIGEAPDAAAADKQQTAVTACAVTAGGTIIYTGSNVGIKAGSTGTVTLMCPVDVNLASFDTLELSYRDSDGTANTGSVEVIVNAVDKTSAVFSTPYVIFESNWYATTAWNNKVQALASTFTFDHDDYFYYVQINLTRSATTTFVPVGHVKLFTTP